MFTAAKVTLMVKDVEHSVKFYRDDLGLRQTVRYGNEWVELEAPGTVIALHPKPQAQILPTAEDDFDRFQVKDLDGTVAKLKKLGVTFKIQDEGFLRRADFAEPDGHRLYLMEVR